MRFTRFTLALCALGCLLFAGPARAVVVGQIDDFEDGTLQNWGNGGAGAPPVLNIPTGGPGGVDDNFMQVTSDGAGPGKYLTVFNVSQWAGDYITPGVNGIEMDIKNLGNTNLTIRLAFKQTSGFGSPGYLSTGFFLPAGGDWQHVFFTITAATMIAVGNPPPFHDMFLTGPDEMRIINETGTGNLNGDIIVGQLGVDNIHAVPEPGAALLTMAGLGLLFAARRRRAG